MTKFEKLLLKRKPFQALIDEFLIIGFWRKTEEEKPELSEPFKKGESILIDDFESLFKTLYREKYEFLKDIIVAIKK
jgi:hypothetical protein